MGKYSVPYSCGHGKYIVEMYGKIKERERRLAWLEAGNGKLCTDCWRKELDAAPLKARLDASLVGECAGIYVSMISGNTYRIKEALKEAGFRWREVAGEGADLLGFRPPQKRWVLQIASREEWKEREEEVQKKMQEAMEKVQKLGIEIEVKMESAALKAACL